VKTYYWAVKKNEILSSAATWVELEDIKLSEASQKQNNKYHVFSFIFGNQQVNLAEGWNRMVVTRDEEGEGAGGEGAENGGWG
jgi:hypothetical protein